MLSGKALDPRLAVDHRELKKSKALVKESPVSSESDSSFDLSEPESPVLRYLILRYRYLTIHLDLLMLWNIICLRQNSPL